MAKCWFCGVGERRGEGLLHCADCWKLDEAGELDREMVGIVNSSSKRLRTFVSYEQQKRAITQTQKGKAKARIEIMRKQEKPKKSYL